MKDTSYHMVLRISALTLALVLLFDSGLLSPVTAQISQNTQDYVASAIGMQASVAPTELNELTAELTARERLLNQRESDLKAREIAVNLEDGSVGTNYSTYIMSILLFILLVLILMNYAFDYVRMRERIAKSSNEKMA